LEVKLARLPKDYNAIPERFIIFKSRNHVQL